MNSAHKSEVLGTSLIKTKLAGRGQDLQSHAGRQLDS